MRWILPLLVCLLAAAWVLETRATTGMDGMDPDPARDVDAPEAPILVGRAPDVAAAGDVDVPTEIEDVEDDVDVEPDKAPPDPIEIGPCLLVVATYDDETGAIFDTSFDLWRIDAPGNEHWTRGDRLYAHADTKDGRAEMGDLPTGRYRVHAHGQRKGTEDLPAFDVDGSATHVRLDLPGLRKHRVFVHVLDERGNRVTHARKAHAGSGGSRSDYRVPAWRTARERRDGVDTFFGIGSGGWRSGGGHRGGGRPVVADDRGFDLGLHQEDARYTGKQEYYDISCDQRTRVEVRIGGSVTRDRAYLGVTVPLVYVYDRVLLSTGERAVDAGAYIAVECPAVLVEGRPEEIDWRDLPIQVRASLDGYSDLSTTFTLADPDWTVTLRPESGDEVAR